jgi:hypothetical protein
MVHPYSNTNKQNIKGFSYPLYINREIFPARIIVSLLVATFIIANVN